MTIASRRGTLLLFLLASVGVGIASGAEPALAIRGYDPVAYFTLHRATPGSPKFTHLWDEHLWYFANSRHRDLFAADPVRYAPQFANFCAVALARGELLPANPEFWLISDGRLYLFGKSGGPGIFREDAAESLRRAQKNLPLLEQPKIGRDQPPSPR
jgi:hypothetical protein